MDEEKDTAIAPIVDIPVDTDESPTRLDKITDFLMGWGIETHGITPIWPESRVDTRLYQMFMVWFSANMNILSFGTGTIGPFFYSLGMRDAMVIVVMMDLIFCVVPAYFAVFGPKLGTRSMVQSRFSWGFYGSIIPSTLNVISSQGYLIINCIIGGQTLASVSEHLNVTVGIVIISMVSLLVTFCGYKVVHWYETMSWVPNVITFFVMLVVGGKHLGHESPMAAPTPASLISFASTVASAVLTWCTMTADYGVYHDAKASSMRTFLYSYLGFFTSTVTGNMLGVAFAATARSIPSWQTGSQNGNNLGGLISAILAPTGGFGKFLTVILALTLPSACAPTMYSFGTSLMAVSPFFAKVPRYVYLIVSEVILIPVAVVGATRFYGSFVNILCIIGYWSSSFAAIVLVEHFIFRKNDFQLYNVQDWNNAKRLPPSAPAILAFFGSFAVIIPSMSQVWYVGPIARAGTGDIGLFVGFVVAGLLYIIFRKLLEPEMRYY